MPPDLEPAPRPSIDYLPKLGREIDEPPSLLLPVAPQTAPAFRDGGTYLATDALGGIGHAIARHLEVAESCESTPFDVDVVTANAQEVFPEWHNSRRGKVTGSTDTVVAPRDHSEMFTPDNEPVLTRSSPRTWTTIPQLNPRSGTTAPPVEASTSH